MKIHCTVVKTFDRNYRVLELILIIVIAGQVQHEHNQIRQEHGYECDPAEQQDNVVPRGIPLPRSIAPRSHQVVAVLRLVLEKRRRLGIQNVQKHQLTYLTLQQERGNRGEPLGRRRRCFAQVA